MLNYQPLKSDVRNVDVREHMWNKGKLDLLIRDRHFSIHVLLVGISGIKIEKLI
jgi:hypothetical protein